MVDCEQFANLIRNSNNFFAFTGAGISTESGIPDFRSPDGIWSKAQPVYFDDFVSSAESRYEYWRQKSIGHQDFDGAKPNIAHKTLAAWEQSDQLAGLITQNIDELHQHAGSQNILELHGTARKIACLSCSFRAEVDPYVKQFLETDEIPDCPECGGILKHATISFGQALEPGVLQKAFTWARNADLFLVIGSSLVVEPAASLPRSAKENGAKLVIINRDKTPLDSIADIIFNESIGEVFQELTAALGNV